jgi:hypothetical protein
VASELVAKIVETKGCDSRAAVALVQPLVPRFLHHVTWEHDFADENFFFRWARDEGIPTFKCACGEFEIEFKHAPRGAFNCHCRFCYTGVATPEKLAREQKDKCPPTSMLTPEGGVAKAWFWLEDVKLPEGAYDKCYFISVNGGNIVRSATKCCNTPVNSAGGVGFPPIGARPFNRNALYMEDGSKWQSPSPVPNVNTAASLNTPEEEIPDPKGRGALLTVAGLFAGAKLHTKAPTEQFFIAPVEDVTVHATVELAS